jgi:hypothetical protein
LAALRANTFGKRQILEVVWGEPPEDDLVLDLLCDLASTAPIGQAFADGKKHRVRAPILQIIFQDVLPKPVPLSELDLILDSCVASAFKHHSFFVPVDSYAEIAGQLLAARLEGEHRRIETSDGVALHFPMEQGSQPHLVLFDLDQLPDLRSPGR